MLFDTSPTSFAFLVFGKEEDGGGSNASINNSCVHRCRGQTDGRTGRQKHKQKKTDMTYRKERTQETENEKGVKYSKNEERRESKEKMT